MAISTDVEPNVMAVCAKWDAVVVGAGPAGAIAARQLGQRGASVLLVDRAAFPRSKVCGCCVNASALRTLERIGLGGLPHRLGAVPTGRLRLFVPGQRISLPIPPGVSISRRTFDWALVREATVAGVTFRESTSAALACVDNGWRFVRLLSREEGVETVAARVVIAADGLNGRLIRNQPSLEPSVDRRGRMGVAVICDRAPNCYEPGTIYMACDGGGYVGLVRLEDGRANVAAALDPHVVKRSGGPGTTTAGILRRTGLPPIEELEQKPWHGTGILTRRRTVLGAHRLLLLGDAAGYVEPFTGEGMAWALASADAVTAPALQAIACWQPKMVALWTRKHRQLIGRRQRLCRWLSLILRYPNLMGAAMWPLRIAPALAYPITHMINAPLASGSTEPPQFLSGKESC